MKKFQMEKYWIWLLKYYLGKWYRVSYCTEIAYILCRPCIDFNYNFTGFHFLINILKFSKESIFLKFSKRRLQIFGPKKVYSLCHEILWSLTVRKIEKYIANYKDVQLFGSNVPFIMDSEIPLLILNISVIRTWRFLFCIETEPSFPTCDLPRPNFVQQSIILSIDLPCFFRSRSAIRSKAILFLSFSFTLLSMASNTDFIYGFHSLWKQEKK